MSERGVFALDRGIWDHDVFADERFTEREAWVWLISEAAWRPRTRNVGGKVLNLDRGQLAGSLRFIADRWGWEKDAVSRFLARLKKHNMITTDTATGISVITICNYDEYQRVSLPDATDTATPPATATRQRCDKTEDIKYIEKNIRSVEGSSGKPVKPSIRVERFDEFWKTYPKRLGSNPKTPAQEKYTRLVKSGVDEAEIITGAAGYAAEVRRTGSEGSKFVKQAQTWLNQSCWKDYQPSNLVLPQTGGLAGQEEIDWDGKMKFYTLLPDYSRNWYGPGAPPGCEGCRVPDDIQRRYGYEPAPRSRPTNGEDTHA